MASFTQDQWITVWCQGGPADDWRYETLFEPDPEITVVPVPGPARFVRILSGDDWPDATTYVHHPEAEQFDHERIFYPKSDGTPDRP